MFDGEVSLRETYTSLKKPATYNLPLFVGILSLSLLTAVLETVGISFILPIIEYTQGSGGGDSRILQYMTATYDTLGVPFTLEYIVIGAILVITTRFSFTFLQEWLLAIYRTKYVRALRETLLDATLNAEPGYLELNGVDTALNGIITESLFVGRSVKHLFKLFRSGAMISVYIGLALFISPVLTVVTLVALGSVGYLIRGVLIPAYAVGSAVEEANEEVQSVVQSALLGNREIRRFGLEPSVRDEYESTLSDYVDANVHILRNEAVLQNSYRMINAVTVFGLAFLGLEYTSLTLGKLALFLVAVFRLSPQISQLNAVAYKAQGNIPHIHNVYDAIDEYEAHASDYPGDGAIDGPVESVEFDDVTYSYDGRENAVEDVSLSVESGEQIALLGRSGAGKSTLISLFTRMYDPDDGEIRIDGQPLDTFDVREWRERVAVVPQDPHVFDETLRYNVMIGNLDATEAEFERACEIARVTDFLDELSEGYDTELGEDADTLSGGQRQRIAIARAMLKDADLLIFDEATSELDAELEAEIHETVENTDRYDMSVFVSHRLETLTDVDRIYFVEDGRITETGTHEELTARGDEYAKLYAQN